MSVNKEFDLLVFGATSFVGQILCDYLVNEHTEPNLSWAMAARSKTKLDQLKIDLGSKAESVPTFIADSSDETSLQRLCSKASVIISTVGPYSLYGELLVKSCAESGTDYCDLTGEAPWIRLMIERYDAVAKKSGARIVNSCGFDSIPSDLGVMFLQNHAKSQLGEYCSKIKMRVKDMRGGASGGTVASGVNMYKEAAQNPQLRKEMTDDYSLCPPEQSFSVNQHQIDVEFDEDFDSWVAPFIMESINRRIVLRSNAIRSGGHYSSSFLYDEGVLTGPGKSGRKKAKRMSFGIGLAPKLLSISLLRSLIVSFFLPKPGEGPSKEQQLNGFYDLRFSGVTDNGEKLQAEVTGDRDPGYGSTAKMLAQAAISLHRDIDKGELSGGFWTPATAFDDRLIHRLHKYAGMNFEIMEVK